MKVLAKNRRAHFDYAIDSTLDAGVVLTGGEVKSIKAGHGSLKGSFITVRDNEVYLTNAHITPYQHSSVPTDPTRTRKLLLHRRQIDSIISAKQSGETAVPLAFTQVRGLIKLQVGIGRSKKRFDKRQVIKQRDTERELARHIKR